MGRSARNAPLLPQRESQPSGVLPPELQTPAELTQAIRRRATELGFDLVGFGPAAPFDQERELFLERLGDGFLRGMGWITAERARLSCDPEALLPGARTIVGLGTSYAPADGPETGSQGRGRVARYARGRDYHQVIPPKLSTLAELIRELGGTDTRCRTFVDTGPLVDRAAARRSGLGFYGKNTCILTGPHGSYVFLSAILTTLELAPDPLVAKDCGSCRACIDACPTDAIVGPGKMDATRCISYLTIEHRGSIPREQRPMMGSWVFGCDVCQEVCPWNRGRRVTEHDEYSAAQGAGADLDLEELLELDEEAFRTRFRDTPLKRAKRAGLLRNAAVALGNLGDRAAEGALVGALSDAEPLVREHAAWALGQIGPLSAAGRVGVEGALEAQVDEQLRHELQELLARG